MLQKGQTFQIACFNHAVCCWRFDLQNWTHILVYSASNGAEQSTPAALRIGDASSSVSGLGFIDKAGLCKLQYSEIVDH